MRIGCSKGNKFESFPRGLRIKFCLQNLFVNVKLILYSCRSHAREELRQAANMYFSKIPKSEPRIDDTTIHDMLQIFGKSMHKTIHLLEQKLRQILGKRSFFKKK